MTLNVCLGVVCGFRVRVGAIVRVFENGGWFRWKVTAHFSKIHPERRQAFSR